MNLDINNFDSYLNILKEKCNLPYTGFIESKDRITFHIVYNDGDKIIYIYDKNKKEWEGIFTKEGMDMKNMEDREIFLLVKDENFKISFIDKEKIIIKSKNIEDVLNFYEK